jgi:hypothetical protein
MTSPDTNGLPHALTNGSNGIHELEPSTTVAFDTSLFRQYMISLLPPVLGAQLEELDAIFDDEFEERVTRFASEGGSVIYIIKVKEESEEGNRCFVWPL